MPYLIEIAVTDYTTARSAAAGGADRIELCTALSEGGLTPSHSLIKQCRKGISIPIFPIIRSRNGDFLYTDEEFGIMLQDAVQCKKEGCDGVVIGFLAADGTIDKQRTERMVEAVYPLEVTFHRAFDRCADPLTALEDIINCGCQRMLTSGQQRTATKGAALIRQLITAADERIIIMPGSGVKPENIRQLAEQTGAVEFHASLRSTVRSAMRFVHPSFATDAESYDNPAIDPQRVGALKQALRKL